MSPPVATDVTRNSALLTWDRGSNDVLNYIIEYRILGSTNGWTTLTSIDNERELLGLDHSKSYEARVTSVNRCCDGDPSDSVVFKTLTPPPDTPLVEGVFFYIPSFYISNINPLI